MNYLAPKDLEGVFEVIQNNYSLRQEVPDYRAIPSGMDSVGGILSGVQSDFYPSLLDKAAYVLVQINSGHFFSNGNKRLALVMTLFFLDLNGHAFRVAEKAEYRAVVGELFPEFLAFEDDAEFNGFGFGAYNISVIIAESNALGIAFDSLKERVKRFLEWAVVEKSV